jgi:hypothetical protein
MTFVRSPSPRSALLVATLGGSVLLGCVSRPQKQEPEREAETGVFVLGSSWLSGALERTDPGEAPYGARAASSNAALRSDPPWLGTVGITVGVPEVYEVGCGVCVPDPEVVAVTVGASDVDNLRRAAVGLWVKFDF